MAKGTARPWPGRSDWRGGGSTDLCICPPYMAIFIHYSIRNRYITVSLSHHVARTVAMGTGVLIHEPCYGTKAFGWSEGLTLRGEQGSRIKAAVMAA